MNIYRAWDKQQNKMRYDITGFECDKGLIEGVFLDGDYYSLIGSCGHPHAEIEQFTGLTDKNGAKIFEGDKLLISDVEGVAKYSDGSFHLITEDDNSGRNPILQERTKRFEIIGNIHEGDK